MRAHAAATVFRVADLETTLRYYVEVLGFVQEFRHGDYAGVERDEVMVHLAGQGIPNAGGTGQGSLYLFCDEVDDYHAEIVAKGARPLAPPQDYDCGLRDFCVTDPDGNRLTFGKELAV